RRYASQSSGRKQNSRRMLEALHPLMRDGEARAVRGGAMVRHQECVVKLKEWFDRVGERWAAWSRVGNQRHATDLHDDLREHRRHEILPRHGERRGEWRVRMDHSSDVSPKLVDAQVHP